MTIRSVFLRVVFWVAIFVAVFSVALALLFESGALTPAVVEAVDGRVAEAGLTFRGEALQWRPWSGLSVTDVLFATRAGADSTQPSRRLVSVRKIDVGYRLTDILRGDLRLSHLKLVGPDLDLDALLDWSARMAHRPSSGAVVRIEDLRLTDGRVRGKKGTLLTKLSLGGSFEAGPGTWRAAVDQARTRLTLGRFDENVVLRGGLEMHEGVLALEDVRVDASGGTIGVRGRLDPRGQQPSEVFLHGDSVPLQKVGDWLGVEHPLLLSKLQCDVAATGRPDSMRLVGNLTGRGADDVERRVDFAGTRVGSRLALEAFRFRAGESLVDLTGQMDFAKGPSIEGVAVFRDVDPGVAAADSDLAVLQRLDGVVRFAGTGLSRRSFRGTAAARIDRAELFGMKMGGGTFQLSLDGGSLSVEQARLTVAGAELRGAGTIDAKDQVQAELTGEIGDLAALALPKGMLGTAAPRGHASARLDLSGPLAGPAVDAALHLEDVSAVGLDAASLEVAAKSERLSSKAHWEFRANGTSVGRGPHHFDRLAADGYIEGRSIVVRTADLASSAGDLHLAGNLDVGEEGRLTALVDQLALHTTNDVRWVNSGSVRVERTPAGVSLSGLDLHGGGGALTGSANFGGKTSVKATGRSVDLALLAPFLPTSKPVAGRLDFDADGVLAADSLGGDVRVDLTSGRWGDRAFDRLSGRVTLRNDRADLQDVSLTGPGLSARVAGQIALPGGGLARAFGDSASRARTLERAVFRHLDAHVDAPDFGWLWSRIPHQPASGGAGTVALRLDGPLLTPSATLHAALAKGSLGPEPLDSLAADATFDGEALTISYGLLRSGAGTLSFSGVVPLEWKTTSPIPKLVAGRAMDLRMDGEQFPLDALAPLISLFTIVNGTADAKLALQGQPGALAFTGDFKVTKGRITIPTFVDPLVDGAATGRFDAKGLELTSARFADGHDGTVEGHGRLDIQNLHATDYDIAVAARNYHYASSLNGITGVGSGKMDILARTASDGRMLPFFQGSFQVSRADIGEKALLPPSALDTGGVEVPPGVMAPPEDRPESPASLPEGPVAPAVCLAEIRLKGDRNLWLKTPEIDSELAADVIFHATESAMGITGNVRTLHGTYAVVNTRFDVTRAEVEFVDPANPGGSYIDAEATTNVLEENVTATVTGTVLVPVVHLTTKSGMSEPEIYEMLALRVKRVEDATDSKQTGVGQQWFDSMLAAAATRFGGELGRQLGIDQVVYDEPTKSGRPSVTVGKNVGRDFFVKYRQAVGVGTQDPTAAAPTVTRESLETPERALTVEYRLNQIFLLQGETGTLPPGDDYLNVDLRAEWGY
ncbi:MAG: translocation/assembly module TamB domain-containing protein [bacterium]